MKMQVSDRLKAIPPYVFAELENKAAQMKANGEEVLDLSIGDPDFPTPPSIVKVMRLAMAYKENQGYSSSKGEPYFREAVADWYLKRFGVKLDPAKEVCALIGSKEGLANVARAVLNPGDGVLVPDPGYPVYANGATFLAGGTPIMMPLLEENNFLPDLGAIGSTGAKLMYLNYPNNPTGAIAGIDFLKKVVDFARKKNIVLCYDNAYSEICFGNQRAHSILEVPGAAECCVEFNSCSKTFNMSGSRIGFAVGGPEIISALAKVKSQLDSGPAPYAQRAGVFALSLYRESSPPKVVRDTVRTYERRMDLLVKGLKGIGIKCRPSPATFYLWVKVGGSSMDFANKLLAKGIVVTPGIGFGSEGEGYIRFALTKDETVLKRAIEKLANLKISR